MWPSWQGYAASSLPLLQRGSWNEKQITARPDPRLRAKPATLQPEVEWSLPTHRPVSTLDYDTFRGQWMAFSLPLHPGNLFCISFSWIQLLTWHLNFWSLMGSSNVAYSNLNSWFSPFLPQAQPTPLPGKWQLCSIRYSDQGLWHHLWVLTYLVGYEIHWNTSFIWPFLISSPKHSLAALFFFFKYIPLLLLRSIPSMYQVG